MDMTPDQGKAIEEVRRILRGHFDSYVLTFRVTDESLGSKIHHDWHGHISDIVGLSTIGHNRLLEFTSLKGAPNAGQ